MASSTIFIDGPPEYKIVNGGIAISAPSGEFRHTIQIPFEFFIAGHVAAQAVFKQLSESVVVDCEAEH